MDDTDRELIRLLSLDARQPAAELARVLNVSRATVQNRIDRLRADGTIRRFTVDLGQPADSTLIEALVLVSLAPGDSRKTIAQLKKLTEVVALTSANGAYDFIMELRVSSLKRLDEVLMDIRRMPMIADTHSSIRMNRFK
jgi:DNA-binding Lrp family transcriptional regulator